MLELISQMCVNKGWLPQIEVAMNRKSFDQHSDSITTLSPKIEANVNTFRAHGYTNGRRICVDQAKDVKKRRFHHKMARLLCGGRCGTMRKRHLVTRCREALSILAVARLRRESTGKHGMAETVLTVDTMRRKEVVVNESKF